jgi:hypothetical protein
VDRTRAVSEALVPTGKTYATCRAHANEALDWMAPRNLMAPASIVKIRATARKDHRCHCGVPAEWFLSEQEVAQASGAEVPS